MFLKKKRVERNQKVYMYSSKLDLLIIMKIVKMLIITFGVMIFSFLLILLLANFGIYIPLLFLIYLLFFEATLIFVLTAIVVGRGRSLRF
jgi:hypothetical protein